MSLQTLYFHEIVLKGRGRASLYNLGGWEPVAGALEAKYEIAATTSIPQSPQPCRPGPHTHQQGGTVSKVQNFSLPSSTLSLDMGRSVNGCGPPYVRVVSTD